MPVLFTKEIKNKDEKYIDLDGAGIIYPYVASKNWNSVYRLEARLKLNVSLTYLEDAVKKMKEKYPYFFSRLCKFGNKYVLENGYSSNLIFKNAPLCKPFDIKGEETLIRIVYTQNTIGVEFSHAITDGHGAELFFNELLKEYCNIAFSRYSYDYPKVEELPINQSLNNINDIYNDIYALGGENVSRFLSKAYQLETKRKTKLTSKSINVFSSALKTAAHKYGLSITQYLCAVELATILKCENVKNKSVRISIPVDIRKYFDFNSSRNASLYFLAEVKPNEAKDFKALAKSVKAQFEKELTRENMQNLAYSNVKCAKMKAYNLLPIALKKAALNIGYTTFGENQFTSTITNLGIIALDSTVKNIVSSAYYILGEEKTKPLNLAVTSYENETKIIISSTVDSTEFIRTMCEMLFSDGIVSEIENLNSTVKFGKNYDAVS